jgi:plastocyanin
MSTTRRTTAAAGLVLTSFLLLAACGEDGDDTMGSSPTTEADARGGDTIGAVEIASFTFDPADAELAAGGALTWTNTDAATHRIKARDSAPAAFESEELMEGDEYSFTFEEPGAYEYFCSIHSYMTGTVVVG